LNGLHLPQEWIGDSSSGSGSFSSVPDPEENAWFSQHHLDIEWESLCLFAAKDTIVPAEASEDGKEGQLQRADNGVQVFKVAIKSIDGKTPEYLSGFTLSFNQKASPPELLRLEPSPRHTIVSETDIEDWRNPPLHLRLGLRNWRKAPNNLEDSPIASSHTAPPAPLEDDLRELEALQAGLQNLQNTIEQKQKEILSRLEGISQKEKEELRNCTSPGFKCTAKVIGQKAKNALRLLYIRIRLGQQQQFHNTPTGSKMGRPDEPSAAVWRASTQHEHTIKIQSIVSEKHDNHGDSYRAPSHSSDLPEQDQLPPYSEHEPSRKSMHLAVLQMVIGILCCGCLVSAVRHSCCSPRTKANRAASTEHRRTAPSYRRGGRWWRIRRTRTWIDQARIDDYEEKRALINSQESLLEDAMQEEIRQLRDAHGLVNDLVRAEEEGRFVSRRVFNQPHHMTYYSHERDHTTPPSPTSSTYTSDGLAGLSSRPLSRTSSLPGYHSDASTAPPAYESDVDASERVANGFQFQQYYTPLSPGSSGPESVTASSTCGSMASRWTPDSSIVDVSPRPSADTLRYAESTGTYLGDCESEGEERH
jgi:hypothetical protein